MKLVRARVSYWNDFLILYRVYMMMGYFIFWLFEGSLHVDKMHTCAIQNRTRYTCATYSSPPAD